jgi:hypothetical protein
MTTQPTNPAEGANWGDPVPAPAPAKKSWSGRKTAIAAGIAVVIAAGGGAAIWAGTSGADTSSQQPGNAAGGPGGFGGPNGGRAGGFGAGMNALRQALHGDFVVADGNGGYTTERLQTGDVTELSATSVTLTSKDGYKQTYTIDSSTQKQGTVNQGDTNVTVIAKVNGQTATAQSLGQAPQLGQRQPGQGGRRNGGTSSPRPTA